MKQIFARFGAAGVVWLCAWWIIETNLAWPVVVRPLLSQAAAQWIVVGQYFVAYPAETAFVVIGLVAIEIALVFGVLMAARKLWRRVYG